MKKLLSPFACALGLLATGATAQDPRNCAPRNLILERLSNGFGETRQSIGLGANNAVIEVFASETTGSWTITVTNPAGQTCLVAAGSAFETVNSKVKAGDPA